MRWSTNDPGRDRIRIVSRPGPRTRVFAGVIGTLLGGIIGYGIVSTSPVAGALLEPGVLAWIAIPAVICGALCAGSPNALLRPGGRFRWRDGPEDD